MRWSHLLKWDPASKATPPLLTWLWATPGELNCEKGFAVQRWWLFCLCSNKESGQLPPNTLSAKAQPKKVWLTTEKASHPLPHSAHLWWEELQNSLQLRKNSWSLEHSLSTQSWRSFWEMCPSEYVRAFYHTAHPGSETRSGRSRGTQALFAVCRHVQACAGMPLSVNMAGGGPPGSTCQGGGSLWPPASIPQGLWGRNFQSKAGAVVHYDTIIASNFQTMVGN